MLLRDFYRIGRTKADHLIGHPFVSPRRVVEKPRPVKVSSNLSHAETSGLHAQHLPIGIDDQRLVKLRNDALAGLFAHRDALIIGHPQHRHH